MMAGKRIYYCVLFCIVTGCCCGTSDTNSIKGPRKRFIMDTFLGPLGAAAGAFSGAAEVLIKGECVLCKCNNTCTGETLWGKYFGLNAGETSVCGKDLWNSINCTDKHNFVTTLPPPTTVPQATVSTRCDKLCAISSIANLRSMVHPNASMCLSGKREGNEALPMQCCHLGNTNTWKKGIAIMPMCLSIPHYTPVAAFINGNFIPGTAGILTACLSNGEIGFQMIRQDCGHTPELVHVSANQTVHNHPNIYYVIN